MIATLMGRGWRWGLAAALALALPFAALLPMGLLWLWQRDATLHWIAGSAVCGLLAAPLVRRARRAALPLPSSSGTDAGATALTEEDDAPDPGWTVHDRIAWQRVLLFTKGLSAERLTEPKAMLATALAVFDEVARHYHPNPAVPVLHVTVPEALLLIERVSRRVRVELIAKRFPLVEDVRIGHAVAVFRFKKVAAPVIGTGYQGWRVARTILNPLGALWAEAGKFLQDKVTAGLLDLFRDRIAARIVVEIGREAINLYSGRCKEMTFPAAEPRAKAEPPPPLRVLVGGRVNAGKSSLVNALAGEVVTAVDVLPTTVGAHGHGAGGTDGRADLTLIDHAGLDDGAALAGLVAAAVESDMILWVVAANQPAHDLDRRFLEGVRAYFQVHSDWLPPPVVVVMSHIDRLRPFNEWAPPYDLTAPTDPKAETIRDARDHVAATLEVAAAEVVPARLDDGPQYNIEAVWTALRAAMPRGRNIQLRRLARQAEGGVMEVIGRFLWSAGNLPGVVIATKAPSLEKTP